MALKDAGYQVEVTLNPADVKVVWDDTHGVLTGNGPHAIDEQTARLNEIVRHRRSVAGRS